MAFPTIPTVADSRVLFNTQADTSQTRTFPNLSSLTKNSGDLLLAIILAYQTTSFSAWGGGFTEFTDQGTGTGMGLGCAYKWSTGSETGTFSVTQATTVVGHAAMFLISIPGAHTSTPPEVGSWTTLGAAAADAPSFNPANWDVEDTLWIGIGGSGESGAGGAYQGISAAPANYSDYVETGISADVVGGVEGALAFRQLNAASEDIGTWSVDTSNARNGSVVIAVRPLTQVEHAIASDFPLGLVIDSNLSPVEKVISSDFPLGLTIDTNLTVETQATGVFGPAVNLASSKAIRPKTTSFLKVPVIVNIEQFIAVDFPLGLAIDTNIGPVEKVIAADFPLGLAIDTNLSPVEKIIAADFQLGFDVITDLTVEGAPPPTTQDTQIYFPVHRGAY